MTARALRSCTTLAAAGAAYLLLVAWLSLVRFPYLFLCVWPGGGRRGMVVSGLLHMAAVVVLSVCIIHKEEIFTQLAPRAIEVRQEDEPAIEVNMLSASLNQTEAADDAADEAYSAIERDGSAEVVEVTVDSPVEAMLSFEQGGSPDGSGFLAHVTEGKKLGGAGENGKGGDGGPDRATFFGTTAYGTKFVFIIDKSGSMEGTAFYRARGELLRCLKQLREDQEFSIVFYNTDAFPFSTEMVKRDKKAYAAANHWVGQMGPGGGTNPLSSLRIALNMNPDAIFLLTDGEFAAPEMVYDVARQHTKKIVPVHTICFTNRHGEPLLKAIANATKATYRYVP